MRLPWMERRFSDYVRFSVRDVAMYLAMLLDRPRTEMVSFQETVSNQETVSRTVLDQRTAWDLEYDIAWSLSWWGVTLRRVGGQSMYHHGATWARILRAVATEATRLEDRYDCGRQSALALAHELFAGDAEALALLCPRDAPPCLH